MSVYSRVLALASISILLACDEMPTAPGDAPIAFESVVRSSNSGFPVPRREVIRSAEEWAGTWDLLHAGQSPVPSRPSIDFGRQLVALVAMGTRSNGCFGIEVTAITLRGGSALDIEVEEVEPGASCGCTLAITQPVHVVRFDRTAAAERFVERRRRLNC